LLLGVALASVGIGRIGASLILGRTSGPEVLGQFNLLLSVALLTSLATSASVQPAAIKFLAERRGRDDQAGVRRLVTGLFIATLVVGAASAMALPLVAWTGIYNPVEAGGLATVVAATLLVSGYFAVRGALIGLGWLGRYATLEGVGNLVLLLGAVAASAIGFAMSILAYYGLAVVAGIIMLAPMLGRPAGLAEDRKAVSYGVVSFVGTASSLATLNLGNLLLAEFRGPEELGFYSAALSVILVLQFVPQLTGLALLPRFAFLGGRGDTAAIQKMLRRATKLSLLLGAALSVPAAVLADPLLRIGFGPQYAERAAGALAILAVGLFFLTASRPAVAFLSGTRHVLVPNAAGVLSLVLAGVLWLLLVPGWGAIGVAIAATVAITFNGLATMIAAWVLVKRPGPPEA
jgi:O-antigen/teichoic acid export membrane protein